MCIRDSHDIGQGIAQDGQEDIRHILVHEGVHRPSAPMPILIDQRYVRRLLCILLHFGNGFGERESAGSQDPHVIQEGVDLLVYIVAGRCV